MAQGKTTVIAPLLALMLADGQRLILLVVPSKLLEMSRDVLRKVFTVGRWINVVSEPCIIIATNEAGLQRRHPEAHLHTHVRSWIEQPGTYAKGIQQAAAGAHSVIGGCFEPRGRQEPLPQVHRPAAGTIECSIECLIECSIECSTKCCMAVRRGCASTARSAQAAAREGQDPETRDGSRRRAACQRSQG